MFSESRDKISEWIDCCYINWQCSWGKEKRRGLCFPSRLKLFMLLSQHICESCGQLIRRNEIFFGSQKSWETVWGTVYEIHFFFMFWFCCCRMFRKYTCQFLPSWSRPRRNLYRTKLCLLHRCLILSNVSNEYGRILNTLVSLSRNEERVRNVLELYLSSNFPSQLPSFCMKSFHVFLYCGLEHRCFSVFPKVEESYLMHLYY